MRSVSNNETRNLIALARAGDPGAIDLLCRVYGERVRRIVRLRMGRELRPKLDSIDLVQEVLVSALGGLESFTYENEGDFLRWLSRIAQNALRDNLDRFHAVKRDIRRELRLDDRRQTTGNGPVDAFGPIQTTTPSVMLSRKEDLDKLEEALDKLKPEYKEVIISAKIDGLSYAEIADELGKSKNAVKHLLSRAMVALTETFWAS